MKKDKRQKVIVDSKESTIQWSEPTFNEKTSLWEVKKTDQAGNELDIISDGDKEALINKKEELIKEYILSQITKQDNKRNNKWGKHEKKSVPAVRKGVDKEEILNQVIKKKLNGEGILNIVKEVSEQYELSPTTVGLYINEAMGKIREQASKKLDEVLELHLRRYEEIYEWLNKNGFVRHATKTLRTKEALMGIGQEVSSTLEVNNILSDNQLVRQQFEINQLSKEQRIKLLEIAKKLKKK